MMIMDLETLKRFSSKDPTRTQILEPWSRGEYSFATDSRILIRVPRLDQIPENRDAPATDHLFAKFPHAGNWLSIPGLPEPQDEPCPECEGSGKESARCQACKGEGTTLCPTCEDGDLKCRKCHGTGFDEENRGGTSCEHCDGSGKRPIRQSITVGNEVVDARYLRLIRDLPNVRIANGRKEACALTFVFDGGDGLIMPIRM